MLEEDSYEVGDFVFAKLKGHPHWPATISQIETLYANGTSGQERTRYNVYFYGSHQMSMIKVDSILRFGEHYELFKRRYANNPKFSFALAELESDKETREDYVKSLQECFAESSRFDVAQDKPDDEMLSLSEENSNDEDDVTSIDSHSPTNSSGFGDGFDSDEEYQTLRNQKYEILSMEKVPYPGSSDYLLVISLGFNERDLQEDYDKIREEIRMMSCFVKIERLRVLPSVLHYNRVGSRHQILLVEPLIKKFTSSVCHFKLQKRGPRGPYRKKNKQPEEQRFGPRVWPELSPKESQGFPEKKRRRRKWKRGKWGSASKPSLTVLAAEAVKRRRRQRKAMFRDETRLLSLRQRNVDAASEEGVTEGTNRCCCLPEKCNCVVTEQPPIITCPICQAQFSSSVDYKQHSFNIHIMGL